MIRKYSAIIFIVSGIFTVLCGTLFFNIHTKQELFRVASYYFIFLSFFIWLALVIKDTTFKKDNIINFFRENLLGICVAAAIVIIFAISIGGYFRVLADETNMIGVSKSMFLNKTTENSVQGFWYYNGYHSLESVMEKRPNFFPFLTSLVHTLRGYSAYNGFILNSILSFLCLFNLYMLIKTVFSKRLGIAAIIMCASYPIFAFSSTSSGFEMLNLLFIILAVRYFYDYISNQQPLKLSKFFITLVLLSQCRYEAAGVVVILMIAAFSIEIKNSFKNIQPFIIFIPLLYLPVLWQRSITTTAAYMESAFKAGLPMFGIRYIPSNIAELLKLFFYPVNNQFSACIISYIGVAGIIYGCVVFFRNIKVIPPRNKLLILTSFSILLYYFVVLMSNYYGKDIGTVYGCRLSLVFIPFIVLSAAFLINSLLRSKPIIFFMTFLLGIFLFFLPTAINDLPGQAYILGRGYVTYLSFLEKYAGDSNMLVITNRPNLITIHNFGAVNFDYANRHKKELILKIDRHLITTVIIIQNINYDTLKPTKDTTLDSEYKLKRVFEIQNDAKDFLRFSICNLGKKRSVSGHRVDMIPTLPNAGKGAIKSNVSTDESGQTPRIITHSDMDTGI